MKPNPASGAVPELPSTAMPPSTTPAPVSPPGNEQFVAWLRQVAPYIHAFRGRTFVIAVPGLALWMVRWLS